MKIHELKIEEEYYKAIIDGVKTFELRKNDRDYQVGDLIQFTDARFKPKDYLKGATEKYYPHPSETLFKITYILKDVPEYGLEKDYCILGIKQVEIKELK